MSSSTSGVFEQEKKEIRVIIFEHFNGIVRKKLRFTLSPEDSSVLPWKGNVGTVFSAMISTVANLDGSTRSCELHVSFMWVWGVLVACELTCRLGKSYGGWSTVDILAKIMLFELPFHHKLDCRVFLAPFTLESLASISQCIMWNSSFCETPEEAYLD